MNEKCNRVNKKRMTFVDFEHCYLTMMLVRCCFVYVKNAIWYGFVIASIVLVEISTFTVQYQLTNFVMLASIVIVKSTLLRPS